MTPTQSLIKMSKGRRALANVLNSGPRSSSTSAAQGVVKPSTKANIPSTSASSVPGSSSAALSSSSSASSGPMSEDHWKVRAESIRTWIGSNPLKLGIPDDGTIETITAQLTRGDKHAASRNKAWHHILLELSCCGGIEALNFDSAELLSTMNTAFGGNPGSTSVSTPSGGDARAADAENVDPRTEPATSPAEPSSVGNPSKAIFALRASSKESLSSAMAAEATNGGVGDSASASSSTAAPIVPPPSLEIPALSNQTLEHLKDMPAEPQSKSARNARPTSSQLPATAVPARSIESLSARGSGPKNFEEMDKNDASGKPGAEGNGGNGDACALPAKKKQPMTMMERQELWMAKKKEKADMKKKAKEEALADSIRPLDVSKSKQSFNLVKAASKLSTAAKSAVAAEKAAASLKAAALARSTAAAKEALAKKAKKGEGAKKKTSLKKVAKDMVDKKKGAAAKEDGTKGNQGTEEEQVEATPFSPTTAMARRRNSVAEVPVGGAAVASEGFPVNDQGVAKSASTPNLKSPNPKEGPAADLKNPGFVKGEFFTRYDSSTRRGHFRVRDGSDFQMNTMFRKRDKFSKKGSAVAVLVGTHAEKNDEQVIEVLFDTDKMGEEECWSWWRENEGRFASPKR
ncbi:hypothetical protein TrRE_jg8934 [Triparma retinervis]|uniref:Uncharacterized protein n=1 Tax=Triparma retinervis TaxID=2557542 RepID=A0A9W7DP88_9STRA|nr:hypothetical protein TrRE_jg8934 [Triparma retinervis]